MDAITMLREDHRAVERLFKQFEKAREPEARREIVAQIVEALSVHSAIEEQVFYPAVRGACAEIEDMVLEGLEEHHIVKWTLSELDGMEPTDERYVAKTTVLIENVRHHVEEEERDMFPAVRAAMGRTALRELGEGMQSARRIAPTHPHPKAPDTPPGNLVVGTASGIADRARDAVARATTRRTRSKAS